MTLRSSLGLAAVCLLSTPALADETVDLLAGQHSDVGDVTLSDADAEPSPHSPTTHTSALKTG